MSSMNEDTLVQQPTADYLKDQLAWDENIYAYNQETYGSEGTLGRKDQTEVVLTRYLKRALVKLNPGLPAAAYQDAIRQLTDDSSMQSLLQTNREKYELVKNGVTVSFKNDKGKPIKQRLKVIDFDHPDNNHFLCVRELYIKGYLYHRRPDIIGFVNGLPLLFIECKTVYKDICQAYDKNLSDYKDTVPHLFYHNAFVVLGNGVEAKIGSIFSKYEHFNDWKRLSEGEPGVVDMETLLKGVCTKRDFLDLYENFILFDDSSGKLIKILARNHQYLGVNRAIEATRLRNKHHGKLGVFWHTQGSGKSYSMAFFSRKVHRKLGGNFTFLICTDREDLDDQIYKTFAGCGLVDHDKDPCRAGSGKNLEEMLKQHKAYVFTMVHKFNRDVNPDKPYSDRDDIIVITDEAHRSQNGLLFLNHRNALPNASRIGFTGTPLFKDDQITKKTFGDYISIYDFQRAVDDKATVPLFFDSRGEMLGISTHELNEKIAEKLEKYESEDLDTKVRLEQDLKREYHIFTADKRMQAIAEDFVEHYSESWEMGKAMFVCIDKITCVKMHGLLLAAWNRHIKVKENELIKCADEQEIAYRKRQLIWMRATRMAVVVSEEQGEVAKFRNWELEITPHRKLIKEGFETNDGKCIDMDSAFKNDEHPFRVAIVCAMWMTGFDVPCLSTLYLDKPLHAHTLMQAIARANRVYAGKNNGMIVDYCGILKNLNMALATYGGYREEGGADGNTSGGYGPVRPSEELLADLEESINAVKDYLGDHGFRFEDINEKTGFIRNRAIRDAKDAVNQNDETRKRFEIMCRDVFKKFKASLTIKGVNIYRHSYDAINIIYNSLQEDVKMADISVIIRELHGVIDENIETCAGTRDADRIFDISKVNFDRMRKEFAKNPAKNTVVQCLKSSIEKRLKKLLEKNPTRTDFQKHYEEIIAAYNKEKDRVAIEKTFDELLKITESLNEEEKRAVKEGLDEETLALFDLLQKPDLEKQDIKRLKKVAKGLYRTLQKEISRVHNFYAKESTRDDIKARIWDYLWDDKIGLPESYGDNEVIQKIDVVFAYILTKAQREQGMRMAHG